MPGLYHIREIHDYLEWLKDRANRLGTASELIVESRSFVQLDTNPWVRFLTRVLDDWKTESSDAELPFHEAYEFLWSCSLDPSNFRATYGAFVSPFVSLVFENGAERVQMRHLPRKGGRDESL